MSEYVQMHCMFDSGTICLAMSSDPENKEGERQLIEQAVADARKIAREALTVTLGDDVDRWEDIGAPYRSAEKQMHIAHMLG